MVGQVEDTIQGLCNGSVISNHYLGKDYSI